MSFTAVGDRRELVVAQGGNRGTAPQIRCSDRIERRV